MRQPCAGVVGDDHAAPARLTERDTAGVWTGPRLNGPPSGALSLGRLHALLQVCRVWQETVLDASSPRLPPKPTSHEGLTTKASAWVSKGWKRKASVAVAAPAPERRPSTIPSPAHLQSPNATPTTHPEPFNFHLQNSQEEGRRPPPPAAEDDPLLAPVTPVELEQDADVLHCLRKLQHNLRTAAEDLENLEQLLGAGREQEGDGGRHALQVKAAGGYLGHVRMQLASLEMLIETAPPAAQRRGSVIARAQNYLKGKFP